MVRSMLKRFGGKISEVKRKPRGILMEVSALQQMLSRFRQLAGRPAAAGEFREPWKPQPAAAWSRLKMNGQKQIVDIRIEPDVFANKDQEMLQDLVRAAVNEASRRVDEETCQSDEKPCRRNPRDRRHEDPRVVLTGKRFPGQVSLLLFTSRIPPRELRTRHGRASAPYEFPNALGR